jgi:hypothetical protein
MKKTAATILIPLFLLIAFVLISSKEARSQEKPKPDSITVYQFTVLPQGFKTGTQIIQDKFLKNGTVSDTVLLQSAMNMLFSNGKAIKIVNPEKEVKKNSPIKK